ncbi:MAG: hypothetical protein NZ703_01705 [Gemmataceae bacterium]|nr:hypothetical protein [Gemmataceae bacterium]MCS7269773.1 hypothetical protein [Gemmataceae bacterium]
MVQTKLAVDRGPAVARPVSMAPLLVPGVFRLGLLQEMQSALRLQ